MKQRITPEQLNELTTEQKERLREWWKPQAGDVFLSFMGEHVLEEISIEGNLLSHAHYYDPDVYQKEDCLPLLTIGQCIDLLRGQDIQWYNEVLNREIYDGYIIDCLWQSVKAVL